MAYKYTRPKIKDYVYIFPTSSTEYLVRIGENDFVYRLKGKSALLLSRIIPYLNGKYTISSIAQKTKIKKVVIEKILERIETFLIDGSISSKKQFSKFKNQIRFFSLWNKQPNKMQELLDNARICIIGNGSLSMEMVDSLGTSGFGTIYLLRESSHFKNNKLIRIKIGDNNVIIQERTPQNLNQLYKDIDFLILCQDAFNPQFCEEVNSFAIEKEKPYILLRKNGITDCIVGPIVVPFLTPCYKCIDLRSKANLDFYDEYIHYENYLKKVKKKKITPCLETTNKLISALTTTELIKYFTGFETPVTYGRFIIINQLNFQFDFHDILKLPRCPVCGIHEEAFNFPWLEPIEKTNNEN